MIRFTVVSSILSIICSVFLDIKIRKYRYIQVLSLRYLYKINNNILVIWGINTYK